MAESAQHLKNAVKALKPSSPTGKLWLRNNCICRLEDSEPLMWHFCHYSWEFLVYCCLWNLDWEPDRCNMPLTCSWRPAAVPHGQSRHPIQIYLSSPRSTTTVFFCGGAKAASLALWTKRDSSAELFPTEANSHGRSSPAVSPNFEKAAAITICCLENSSTCSFMNYKENPRALSVAICL